jgi:hypothetical protein
MSLLPYVRWLAATPWSIALNRSDYAYPLVESLHVWALTLFVGSASVWDLRLLGWALTRVPVSEVARRILPWTVVGFVVMFITGVFLVYAIPERTYLNIFFRAKVVFFFLAGLNAWVFHHNWRSVADWDLAHVNPRSARFAGAASLILWFLIIFAGRMIAYNWFDCDKHPQPRIINLAAGCPVEANVQ